jgi:uncharacterized protein YkwD
MSSTERIVLIGSLILNAVLVFAVVFMLLNRPSAEEAVAQIEPTATVTTAELPTQTPIVITVVSTPTEIAEEPAPEVEVEPTETAIATEPPAPTETMEPSIEPTATPEPSPTPQPEPTEAVYTGPPWLQYTNKFRAQAGLPLLVEDEKLSEGAANHSIYMINNSSASHSENPGLSGYTDIGLQAGRNGNIAISGVAGTTYNWPIEYWMSAAFHTIPMLDPALQSVGYGDHSDVNSGFGMAATMDVKSGLREDAPSAEYPIMFPRDGGQTWVTRYNMPEFPNTAAGCSGYQKPTGAPIILMLGDGDNIPQIRETRLQETGRDIPHCAFDETNYYNPEAYWQETGRTILSHNNSVVILPRSPLNVGQSYTVYVNNGGEEIEWSFTVVENPLIVGSETSE